MAISLTALELVLRPLAGASGGSEIGVVVTKSFLINLGRATLKNPVAGIVAERSQYAYAGRRGEDLDGIAGEERCDRLSENNRKFQVGEQPEPGSAGSKNDNAAQPSGRECGQERTTATAVKQTSQRCGKRVGKQVPTRRTKQLRDPAWDHEG